MEELGQAFLQRDRRASANYAIDSEGRVALYVEESDRAWTSSSADNDHRAVTIEVANDEIGGDWHVSDEAFETLVALCTAAGWRPLPIPAMPTAVSPSIKCSTTPTVPAPIWKAAWTI